METNLFIIPVKIDLEREIHMMNIGATEPTDVVLHAFQFEIL